ncbi:MAG: hypothetical protein LBK58_15105 [Prevotellaceae bacterium]|nr:hypothetical protein [Prevotellaceae bacterium]
MKKEFGKWLMDIAKYITTAILLTSAFGEIRENKLIVLICSAVAIVATLGWGLYLIREKK